MLGRTKITGCLAALLLLLAPAFAQSRYRAPQRAPQSTGPRRAQAQPPRNQVPQDRASRNQPGHAGAWLRNYKDLSPAQQHRALESDPQFRRLPPQRQMQLRKKLQRFSGLPPQQQERMLGRMETWEHLTPGQKQQARQLYQHFRQLPPERRQAVNQAIRGMRGLSPAQRDRLIHSDQYQRDFSPQERGLLDGASHLPLAPGGLQPE
jgi:Protein of unknown function (DUF3106)